MIAVLFDADIVAEQQARYLQLAADLKPLLVGIDGFIAIERFQSLHHSGTILSLSWWHDEAAVRVWRDNVFHQVARAEGRKTLFSSYRVRIAGVLRDDSSLTEGRSDVWYPCYVTPYSGEAGYTGDTVRSA